MITDSTPDTVNRHRHRRRLALVGAALLLATTGMVSAASTASAQDEDCASGPGSPDRGRIPLCDTPSGVHDGVTYTPSIEIVGGDLRPGGQVEVSGSGWRPEHASGVSVRWNDAGGFPSRPTGLLEGSPLAIDAAGNVSGTVTLPTQADINEVLRSTGATRTWLRFLSDTPALSLHIEYEWDDDDDDDDGDGDVGGDITVATEIPVAGGLALSITADSVDLGAAQLGEGVDAFVVHGELPDLVVTDTRSANPGWVLSGRSSDFAGPDGASIDGRHLGLSPEVRETGDGQVVAPGPTVAAGDGFVDGAVLAVAELGEGRGTARVGAAVTLEAPTSTPPGRYEATIVLTLV